MGTLKREILDTLKRKQLLEIADELEITLSQRRAVGPIREELLGLESLPVETLLDYLHFKELKDVCRALGLNDKGRAKADLVARILSRDTNNDIDMPLFDSIENAPVKTPKLTIPKSVEKTAAKVKSKTKASSQDQGDRGYMKNFSEKVSFIWAVADLLRGDYKQSEYGRVVLPFTVLRRLDCVLDSTKMKVLATDEKYRDKPEAIRHKFLCKAAEQDFYNTSKLTFGKLLNDANNIAANVTGYINGFSENMRKILEHFRFETQIERLENSNLLFKIVQKFNTIDLHPDKVSNMEMGYVFEELIRKFSEQSNETAGEHFTPREVIKLMVHLIFNEDDSDIYKPGIVKTLMDPACGTGGMLSVAQEYLEEHNPDASLEVFGQELNPEAYAICSSDMMLKGKVSQNIKYGNSFSNDELKGLSFDYFLSNPPYGVSWKKVKSEVEKEYKEQGFAGRFGPGLPRINDGSLLFLMHMISKMKPVDKGGSRLAIVFNGSPLFTGSAGSGESDIRKWIIENDMLEAIVALPNQLFYNTGINTYVWLVTNRKSKKRRGKVQLINAVEFYQKMRKSLGDKRNELSTDHIAEITRLYGEFGAGDNVKIFNNEDFGFARITVERPLKLNFQASKERIERLKEQTPFQNLATSKKKKDKNVIAKEIEEGKKTQALILKVLSELDSSKLYKSRKNFVKDLKSAMKKKGGGFAATITKAILAALSERDETADVCLDSKGNKEPDSDLRDYENVPLTDDIDAYMEREVLPHVPDAWVDRDKTKVGYEIPFTRHFYEYTPPRPLEDIDKEIRALEDEIQGMLSEVLA